MGVTGHNDLMIKFSQFSNKHHRGILTLILVKANLLLVAEVIQGGTGDLGGQGVRTGDMMTTILTPGDTGTTMIRTDTARARPPGTGTAATMTRRSTIMTRRTTTGPWHMTDPGAPGLCTGTFIMLCDV